MPFGLGLVLDALRDESFAWWVRFAVDVARRDAPRTAGTSVPRFLRRSLNGQSALSQGAAGLKVSLFLSADHDAPKTLEVVR